MPNGSGLLIFSLVASALALAVVFLWLGWFLGTRHRRSEEAEDAQDFLARSQAEIQALKRQAVQEARQEWEKTRVRLEEEWNRRSADQRIREESLSDRERSIRDKALAQERDGRRIAEAETGLRAREKEAADRLAEARAAEQEYRERLERLAGMDRDEAKRLLFDSLKMEAKYDAARLVKEIREEAQRNAEFEAKKIISLAIERMASDVSHERTVSSIQIASDKLKGRIIGHEGRNIKAFEKATGIQVIVDESPDTIVLSGFNPVRRELAKMTLEALLDGGNIHPKRIEETVIRCEKKLLAQIRESGQKVVRDLKIKNVHPDLVELLGRLKFRTSYGQNVLDHSLEVAHLTRMMAAELRLDETLALRAGLFHDIGKAIDYETEGTHPEIGMEVAARLREPDVVVNAIGSHHEDVEVIHPISVLVAAADAISGARPGARRKSLTDYVQRIERLENLANSFPGVEQSYAIQAGREVRVIAQHEKLDDAQAQMLASDLAKRIQAEMEYPGRIKVTVIRQLRAVETAR